MRCMCASSDDVMVNAIWAMSSRHLEMCGLRIRMWFDTILVGKQWRSNHTHKNITCSTHFGLIKCIYVYIFLSLGGILYIINVMTETTSNTVETNWEARPKPSCLFESCVQFKQNDDYLNSSLICIHLPMYVYFNVHFIISFLWPELLLLPFVNKANEQ